MREHFPAQHARAEGPQRNKDLRSKSLDFPSPAPSYIIAANMLIWLAFIFIPPDLAGQMNQERLSHIVRK